MQPTKALEERKREDGKGKKRKKKKKLLESEVELSKVCR